MRKITTGCCALCQIDRVSNDTSILELANTLKQLKYEKDINTEVGITTGDGQTATFTIVSPGEDQLEQNLIKLGYKMVHTFERRKGYNEVFKNTGDLKLYIKNL